MCTHILSHVPENTVEKVFHLTPYETFNSELKYLLMKKPTSSINWKKFLYVYPLSKW